ncbi:hypothetical protein M2164_000376 [Streptomyces sp. SAI-208]|uniref:hypothetical protein n=1 Tax=unclassified Streptomyces TaxID=2593676 RepID=UPI002475CFFB|nr:MULTISPECIES: hypothetical protein [unclassified Streptomyces]MDH6546079.1 hypothetical protein [Streptomyces sp. SAI-041]MDH6604741.1 hypothetical protein [Streptomyces sp. SAI-208]
MTMATRKSEITSQSLEVFEVKVGEEDWDALREDPETFFRSRLEPDYKVNGICIDAKNLRSLETAVSGGFATLVHVSGGPFDSYYFWPQHQQ